MNETDVDAGGTFAESNWLNTISQTPRNQAESERWVWRAV